jgi:hypothetical protein
LVGAFELVIDLKTARDLQESFRLTRHPRFPDDLARIIHDADARFLDRHIEPSKIVHVALLLLMLEAAYADLAFIISLKRSTLIFSYPQAGRPITPSFGGTAVVQRTSPERPVFDLIGKSQLEKVWLRQCHNEM